MLVVGLPLVPLTLPVLPPTTLQGRATCELCMPYESNLTIFVARGPRRPLPEIWPSVKHFD